MIIDIRKTVFRKKLRSFFTTIFFTISIAVLLLTNLYSGEIAGISKYGFCIILAVIYILTIVFKSVRDFHYIYYSDEGDKIILRYFSMSIFTSRKNSIEIKKQEFGGYRFEKSFLGLKEKVTLTQKTPKGLAKYPTVSISALSREEKEGMLQSLESFGRRL